MGGTELPKLSGVEVWKEPRALPKLGSYSVGPPKPSIILFFEAALRTLLSEFLDAALDEWRVGICEDEFLDVEGPDFPKSCLG